MLNRFLTLSTVIMGAWIVILSPVPAPVFAFALATLAGAAFLLACVIIDRGTLPSNVLVDTDGRMCLLPVSAPVRVYQPAVLPVGFQEVVAPPAVVVQDVASTEPVSEPTVKAPLTGRCDYDDTLAAQELADAIAAKRRAAALKGLETKRLNAARKLAEQAKVAPKVKAPSKPRAAAKAGKAPE